MNSGGPEIALRAVGTALAGTSIAFAGYMFAFGGGKVRVLGMDHLAIFAQPRGPTIVRPAPPEPSVPSTSAGEAAVDMAATGSVAEIAQKSAPPPKPEIVAARSDRVWFRINGAIVGARPGEDVPEIGRIGAIVPRDGGWAVLDDKGATLLTLAAHANGAALFSHRLIFD